MKYLNEIKNASNTNEILSNDEYSDVGNRLANEIVLKEKTDNTKEIKNIDELTDFLRKKGENHTYYHHYTTSSSLNMILKNKTLRLTRGNSTNLNDWHEWDAKGQQNIWNKTYIACFSYGAYEDFENMAMWGLYGLPSKEAVRLSIPKNSMNFIKIFDRNDRNSVLKLFKDDKKKEPIGNDLIESIVLSDVFYFKDKGQQSHNGTKLIFPENHVGNLLVAENATGIVKNYAWNYEKEVRIIVRFKVKQYDEKNELLNNIYLDFPEEIISSFKITKGPNFDENFINYIYDISSKNNEVFIEKNNKKLIENIDDINKEINRKKEENKKMKNKKTKIDIIELKDSIYKGLIHFKSDDFIQVIKNDKRENR